jgi:hypothetical protein
MSNQLALNIAIARDQIAEALREAYVHEWPLSYLDENLREIKA